MKTKIERFETAMILLLATLLLGGNSFCDRIPLGLESAKEIMDHPTKWEGKVVRVRGKVTYALKVPLIGMRIYKIEDGTGEIAVLTSEQLPEMGSTLLVKGTVSTALIMGQSNYGTHIRETQRW
ncbi:MAG: hypothetical protein D6795_16070 [Deltaproteobacteria bacterium]|nr:MAG: hypothetical protein D6795_16070 [Deltaproteobacteria bacterium]